MTQAPADRPYIVFLTEIPFSVRDVERFGVVTLQQQGIDLTVLEINRLTGIRSHASRSRSVTALEGVTFREVVDQAAWRAELPTLTEAAAIICGFGAGYVFPQTLDVYRLISASQTPYILLMSNYLPITSGPAPGLGTRLKRLFRRKSRLDIMKSLMARLPIAALGLRPADFVIYGGTKSVIPRRLITSQTKPIHAHAMDYDLRLRHGDPKVLKDRQAVFIDQGFGFHPDAKLQGIDDVVDKDAYYPALRRFFDRVEAELDVQVVISAHPRVNYDDIPGIFGPRTLSYGRTTELVRDSVLVISAYSSALGLAILYGKPILLHASRDLIENPYLEGFIEGFANRLGLSPQMIDQPPDGTLAAACAIDEDKRRAYVAEYMKWPGSPEKYYWDIVIDCLREYGALPAESASVAGAPAIQRAG